MNRIIDMDLLQHVDDAAELRIAEEFPIDWRTDALFEKTYGRYLDTTQEGAHAAPRTNKLRIFRLAGLAACLLVTVGAGLGIWSRQQKLPSQPDPAPVEVTEPTEDMTEVQTEVPTLVPQETEFTKTPPIMMTETVSEIVTEPAVPLETIRETESPAAPQISQQDAPPEQPAETQSAPSVEVSPETETPTDAPEEEQLDGFRVLHFAGFRQIICTDAFPEPDGALVPYTVRGDAELLQTADTEDAVRTYEVALGGKVFTVTQREYASFVMDVDEGDLINIGVNRSHGFFLLQGDTCTLYWFCNGEGFCISGDIADLQRFLAIARSFTPADGAN